MIAGGGGGRGGMLKRMILDISIKRLEYIWMQISIRSVEKSFHISQGKMIDEKLNLAQILEFS